MMNHLLKAEELGVKLEIVNGLPLWEPMPLYRHQREVKRIGASIKKSPSNKDSHCNYITILDVYIYFPDGSLKRPDISIFCKEPEELDTAITMIPEAVIEVISKGYEAKDLDFGLTYYLSQGIKDVIIFNPFTLVVLHARKDGTKRHVSPVDIDLECGCYCKV
ncbi:MAG: Uma2 family endonuclease [Desulfobacterales bacterium]|nr:Uma2 family endonuclease [Desulfobacterales bacterium]